MLRKERVDHRGITYLGGADVRSERDLRERVGQIEPRALRGQKDAPNAEAAFAGARHDDVRDVDGCAVENELAALPSPVVYFRARAERRGEHEVAEREAETLRTKVYGSLREVVDDLELGIEGEAAVTAANPEVRALRKVRGEKAWLHDRSLVDRDVRLERAQWIIRHQVGGIRVHTTFVTSTRGLCGARSSASAPFVTSRRSFASSTCPVSQW